MGLKYYHNPRCSKSRQGLELLKDKGFEVEIVLYLEEKLIPTQVEELLTKFLKSSGQKSLDPILRKNEDEFKAIAKLPSTEDVKSWAKLICKSPKILERPVLVGSQGALLGRPPEELLRAKELL